MLPDGRNFGRITVCIRPCPCPPVFLYLSLSLSLSIGSLSLFLSVCVSAPLPDRLCHCPFPSVSHSLSICVPDRLCHCPLVFLSLSICVPVLDCCVLLPVLVHVCVVSVSMGELCHAFLNRLLLQRTTFNANLLPEKSRDNFYSYFYCQRTTFSPFKPLDSLHQINFSVQFDPFNGPNQRKLLFESNLPISGKRNYIFSIYIQIHVHVHVYMYCGELATPLLTVKPVGVYSTTFVQYLYISCYLSDNKPVLSYLSSCLLPQYNSLQTD
jgi:hypothetical protein